MYPTTHPYAIDFGIRVGREKKPQRKAPDDFLLQHFDALTATKINFVPIMLRSLVLAAATELADILRDQRREELKRHTRLLRDIVRKKEIEEYKKRGAAEVATLRRYTDRYRQLVYTDCWLFIKGLEEQAMNQLPAKSRAICAYVTYVALIATFARTYETHMNKMISQACGETVTKPPEMYSSLIHALCVDIAEVYGYQLEISRDARLWVEILSNKALALCETCYNEEN